MNWNLSPVIYLLNFSVPTRSLCQVFFLSLYFVWWHGAFVWFVYCQGGKSDPIIITPLNSPRPYYTEYLHYWCEGNQLLSVFGRYTSWDAYSPDPRDVVQGLPKHCGQWTQKQRKDVSCIWIPPTCRQDFRVEIAAKYIKNNFYSLSRFVNHHGQCCGICYWHCVRLSTISSIFVG